MNSCCFLICLISCQVITCLQLETLCLHIFIHSTASTDSSPSQTTVVPTSQSLLNPCLVSAFWRQIPESHHLLPRLQYPKVSFFSNPFPPLQQESFLKTNSIPSLFHLKLWRAPLSYKENSKLLVWNKKILKSLLLALNPTFSFL